MNVKKHRTALGFTQKDLSQWTGLSVRQIRDIESGKVKPTTIRADTALRLSRAFGISVEELLGVIYETDTGKLLYASEFVSFTSPNQ